MSKRKREPRCNCENERKSCGFYYLVIDKHMGFEDEDYMGFTPKYCPWCGKQWKDTKNT